MSKCADDSDGDGGGGDDDDDDDAAEVANPIEPCSTSSSSVDEVKSIIGRKHCSLSLSLFPLVFVKVPEVFVPTTRYPSNGKSSGKEGNSTFHRNFFLKLERLSLVSTRH